jgi:CheY-like chemotaxis protein
VRPSTPSLEGLRVLLVEDYDDSRELLSVLLLCQGADVIAVPTAAEALALYEALPYDVIVSDLNLPGEDGCALLDAVRALERDRDNAAFAVAYSGEPQAVSRALRHGFDYVVPKPEVDQLIALLGHVAGTLRTGGKGGGPAPGSRP